MPTKAQNDVYQKYKLRKGETARAIRRAQDAYHAIASLAWGFVLDADHVARMNVAAASLIHLSEVWRAYQECDRDG